MLHRWPTHSWNQLYIQIIYVFWLPPDTPCVRVHFTFHHQSSIHISIGCMPKLPSPPSVMTMLNMHLALRSTMSYSRVPFSCSRAYLSRHFLLHTLLTRWPRLQTATVEGTCRHRAQQALVATSTHGGMACVQCAKCCCHLQRNCAELRSTP